MARAESVPEATATVLSLMRMVLGAVILLAPRLFGRFFYTRGADPGAMVSLRMFGVRDLAMGLGALLAQRHGSESLRGWVDAAVLADAADALTLAADRGRGIRQLPRRLGMASAAGAAAAGAWAARGLQGDH